MAGSITGGLEKILLNEPTEGKLFGRISNEQV